MRIRIRILLGIYFLTALVVMPSHLVQAKRITKTKIKMDVSVGFEQSVKAGRMAAVKITCENKENRIAGYLQMLVNGSKNHDNCMYQSRITLNGGEKKVINTAVPITDDSNKLTFQIIDMKGDIVISKEKEVTMERDQTSFYVGLIGEGQDYLKVVGGNSFKVVPIADADIPQSTEGLDMLDAIYIGVSYIQNQKTQKLEHVKEWNKQGGNLFLGCKSEEFLTFLGVHRSNGKAVKGNTGEVWYNVYDNENGIILEWVASEDFITAIKASEEFAKTVIDDMNTHFSNIQGRKIYQEIYTKKSCENNLINSLEISDVTYLPRTALYTIILIAYVLLVGPIFFFILRKWKKTIFYYAGVIIISAIFTVILLMEGKNTRVDAPIVDSVTFLHYEEESKKVNEKNYFSIKLPISTSEIFSIEKKCRVELKKKVEQDEYSKRDSKCNILITSKEERSTVEIKNSLYMKPYIFESESNAESEGTITYDLSLEGEKLSGKIQNQLGFDLENAILISDYRLIPIGQLEDGAEYTLGEEQCIVNYYEMTYHISSVIKRTSNLKNTRDQNDLKGLREFAALAYCLQNSCVFYNNETYLIGFVKETDTTPLEGMEEEGIQCVIYRMNGVKKEYDGKKLLTDFLQFYSLASGSFNIRSRVMETDTVVLHVLADSFYSFDSLIYNETLNEGIDFKGDISLYNKQTHEYDKIFQEGNVQKIDKDKYIASNNYLTIKYFCPHNASGNQENVLPILSAVMEVKSC